MNLITIKHLKLIKNNFNNFFKIEIKNIKLKNNYKMLYDIKNKINYLQIDINNYYKKSYNIKIINNNYYIILNTTQDLINYINIEENIHSYQVGGCVRDEIMDLTPKDYDFVVVNNNIVNMLKLNFKQVGADFPVFLHPITGDEYALTRKEKSIGKGYHDFEIITDNITLKDDLYRRDLTINAIAKDKKHYIDYYGGIKDIKNRILKHTSEAFMDDSLRIFRLARFSARFPTFIIANETSILVDKMIKLKMIDNLTPERLWLETQKALKEKTPENYFNFLNKKQILNKLFLFNGDYYKGINKIENDIKIQIGFIIYNLLKIRENKIQIINNISKNLGNLSSNIKYNLIFFTDYKNKLAFNNLQKNLINGKYKNIINFITSFKNKPFENIKTLYKINKTTNSKRQNKNLIPLKILEELYNDIHSISVKDYVEQYQKRNNKMPEIEQIKNMKFKLQKIKLQKKYENFNFKDFSLNNIE